MSTPSSQLQPNNDQWIDFYALLDLPMDAANNELRRTIGEKYTEARANYDHRDLNQRHYFQALSERILPQCRRILLDDKKRALYDEQCHLHRANDPRAVGYVAFRAALNNPETRKNKTISLVDLPALDNPNAPLSDKLHAEVEDAQSLLRDMENGLALDLLPASSITSSAIPTKIAEAPPNTPPAESETRAGFSRPISVHKTAPVAPAAAPPTEKQAEQASRIFDEAFVRVAGSQSYLESTSLDAAPLEDEPSDEVRAQTMIINGRAVGERSNRNGGNNGGNNHASRLSVGETPRPRRKSARDERRILSPLALKLLTGIVAVMLSAVIQYSVNAPATATGDRVPLVVSYSPEMKTFLEGAKTEFEKTENGAKIELILQPQDARAGMRQALGQDGSPPDVWIPAEAMWHQRYNQIAPSKSRSTISTNSPLALSPLVLVARADRARALLKRFPNRHISSWEALRVAVAQDAPGHLGMTDPNKSGSGAIVRYFMAREWSEKHNVAWNDAATGNAALWKWMGSFEKNVPATSGATADLVKDMVLGTRGLYWWTIAYESDAIHWLNEGKGVEIFYLPVSNFAEHPFCYVAHLDAPAQARAAFTIFERFLRTAPMQQMLLQNGFRPTEIDLKTNVKGNPFIDAKFKKRGLKTTGFPLDERLDYKLINKVAQQWDKRFTS